MQMYNVLHVLQKRKKLCLQYNNNVVIALKSGYLNHIAELARIIVHHERFLPLLFYYAKILFAR